MTTRPIGMLAGSGLQLAYPAFTFGPVDIVVDAGRIQCVVGPNGAGKTTLLSLLLGMVSPDAGALLFEGEAVEVGDRSFLRRVGWVADTDDLPGELTAEELWEFVAVVHARVDGRVGDMLQRARAIAEHLDFQPPTELIRTFSHGMRKKTQLVAGLLHSPSVVLLDEARNGLDPLSIHRLGTLLRSLRDAGTGLLLATHDLHYAERTADHLVVLHKGTVLREGPVADVVGVAPSLESAFLDLIAAGPVEAV